MHIRTSFSSYTLPAFLLCRTGYLRKTVYDGLGGAQYCSQHEDTGWGQDEGQHLQSVYPRFRERTPKMCAAAPDRVEADAKFEKRKLGSVYYCPGFSNSIAQDAGTKEKLYRQWAKYWDMSKPYLLQKTPTLDVLFLESMKLDPTVHVMVMGHPLVGHSIVHRPDAGALLAMTVWLDIWANVLGQLADGQVELYAVVNFETLILHHEQVSLELSTAIKEGCGLPQQDTGGHNKDNSRVALRRRLDLREGNSTQFLAPKEKGLKLWEKCETKPLCKQMMEELTPIMAELGYTWDRTATFQTTKNGNGSDDDDDDVTASKVLFSPQNPPAAALVRRMKALAEKYTNTGGT